ncbi:MAG: hypothetical protein LAO08_20240 [Acidobacteriia bacterium]|nr:hypothetical protein [Terriglobia bacterium]
MKKKSSAKAKRFRGMKEPDAAVTMIQELTLARQGLRGQIERLRDEHHELHCHALRMQISSGLIAIANKLLVEALRDLFAYYDRREQSGWTAADMKRIDEIRRLPGYLEFLFPKI